jgi:Ankyrin repeats (3 copies)/Ankyrin repeat
VQILLYISTAIIAWLGLRHLVSIIIGQSHEGTLKPGQRLCHFTSLMLLWGGCGTALYLRHFWPLIVAAAIEYGFRKAVIRSGEKVCKCEKEMLLAVRTNNFSELKNLIEIGADINWQDSKMEGATALHEAVRKGSNEIIEYLLQNGAIINSKNHNGLTPIHVAAYCGQNVIINTLIEQGAEVNAKARDNITPLHAAAIMGHLDTVELLINRGAEVHVKSSKDGSTPQDFAVRGGHQDVTDALSRY